MSDDPLLDQSSTVDPEKPKSKRLRLFIFGFIGLFFICGVCGFIAILLPSPERQSSTSEGARQADVAEIPTDLAAEESTAVVISQATATLEPTHTPVPTHTPLPTNTPLPTATSLPTPIPSTSTPQPTSTSAPDEQAIAEILYATQMSDIAETYESALLGLATQSTEAGTDPLLIFNDDWLIKTGVYLAGLTLAGESLRELDPPERFHEVHEDMLEAAGYFDLVVKYYAEGVDEVDPDKLNLASTNMLLGAESVSTATDKLVLLTQP